MENNLKRSVKIMNGIKKREGLITALIMSLLPLLCCIVTCALEGRGIKDVYLPGSEWNDELFYFKQVEGIINYGFPQGFFGFNESHALKLSFAAWSPVLVWPWLIWGAVFGWNLMSPIYCNIFLMMLTMFLFVWLVKPSKKQLGILAILFITFTPFTRYMLSGMPEVICFSMVILVLTVGICYLRKEHLGKLVLLFVMTSVMTLMRPYLIVFMLLPIYLSVRKSKWIGAGASLGTIVVTGGAYAAIKHFLGAEYFAPLFDTTWVEKFLHEGIFQGTKYVIYRLWTVGKVFTGMLLEGFKTGLASGALFAGFMLVMAILFIQAWMNYRKKEKNALVINLYLAICFFGMWMALLLMYKMTEGSKHLATFIAVGIFAICLMETRFYKKMIVATAVFAYLYSIMALDPYDYQIPFRTQELVEEEDTWQSIFDSNLEFAKQEVPNFENVVIWTFNDVVNEKSLLTPWQYLYMLPEGYGISCCERKYVLEELGELKSKYLAVVPGGEIETLCVEQGKKEVGRSEGMVLYELH